MAERIIRAYADTSVYGGILDEEFAEASTRFFERVKQGRITLVISRLVVEELAQAPSLVREAADEVLPLAEIVSVTEQAEGLMRSYIEHGIVNSRWEADALHVALASTASCQLIVSWNFKHIVNFNKIRLYNAVNVLRGVTEIAIHSPVEVVQDEQD